MKYNKPEIIELASAVNSVQGSGKDDTSAPDTPIKLSVGAYEADE